MKIFMCWALAITGIICSACDDDDDSVVTSSMNDTDRNFVLNASEANLAEIELGQLAALKSSSASVRSFGQMMMEEHQVALDELDSIADKKDAELTTTLNAKHEEMKSRLSTLVGFQFDTAYMNGQVKDHQATRGLFETEISAGADQDIQDYANKYLPHIQMHLDEAISISNELNQ
jgi:putative membrane protein